MSKPFIELRKMLVEKDLRQQDLNKKIGKSDAYFSSRINGKKPFDFDVAYKILDVLEIPRADVFKYFPPHGMSEK